MTNNAGEKDFHSDASHLNNGVKVFFIPGTNPSAETIETLQKQVETLSEDQFNDSITKDNIKNLIALFTHDASSELAVSFLSELESSLENDKTDTGDIAFLHYVKTCVPELRSFIDVLLDPRFYANKDQSIAVGESLFAALSKDTLRKEYEGKNAIGIEQEISYVLEPQIQPAEIENRYLKEFQDYINRNLGELLPHVKEESTLRKYKNLFKQCVFSTNEIKEKNNKNRYVLNLIIPQTLFYLLESDDRDLVAKKFKEIILHQSSIEYGAPCQLQYKVFTDSLSTSQTKSIKTQPSYSPIMPIDEKKTPPTQLMQTYKQFNFRSVPEHKDTSASILASYPSTFSENEKQILAKNIVRPKGTATLCITADSNIDIIFEALQANNNYSKTNNKKNIISRYVDATDLLALNRAAGQTFKSLTDEQRARYTNPFFAIENYCDYLVVTNADIFLQGRGEGTFHSLCEAQQMQVILVTRKDNLEKVPLHYTSKKTKEDIPLREPLALNIIQLPTREHQAYEYLKRELATALSSALTLFSAPPEVQFSHEFYKSIVTISNNDPRVIKAIFVFVTKYCQEHPTVKDEKDVIHALFEHYQKYKLFTTPVPFSLDDVYQIIAAQVMKMIHKEQADACIGDMHVKNAVVRYLVHLCTTGHNMTAPFGPYTLKEIKDYLETIQFHYPQTELNTYRQQKIDGSEMTNFKLLCEIINTQIVEKLMTGHINSVLSPRPIDPIAGIR